jgi:hypothetical protein
MWRTQYRDAKDNVSDVPQPASQEHPLAFAKVAVVIEFEQSGIIAVAAHHARRGPQQERGGALAVA